MPAWPAMPTDRAPAAARAAPSPAGAAARADEAARPEPVPFAYALIRVVPRIERGECLNLGVVLFCRPRRFLGLRLALDRARLHALDPALDLDALARHGAALEWVAAGDPAGGAIARLPAAERFGWLVAPASTVVQPGPVHAGLTVDPAATLDHLFATLVQLPARDAEPADRSRQRRPSDPKA